MGSSVFYNTLLKRKYPILAILLCFSMVNFFLYHGPIISESSVIINSDKLQKLFSHYHQRHQDVQKYKVRSRAYDEILEQENMYDFLRQNSFQDRCNAYFQILSLTDPEWSVNPNADVSYSKEFTLKAYKEKINKEDDKKIEDAKKKGETPPEKHTDEQIKTDFEVSKARALDMERTLHDFVAHVRVFDKCFIKTEPSDKTFVKKQRDFLNKEVTYIRDEKTEAGQARFLSGEVGVESAEKKIFPFLTHKYPIFKHWNGETAIFPGKDYTYEDKGTSFLKDFKSRLNGKGIVMTISDEFVPKACRLIRVLRAHGNQYPIQVVYHAGLSDASQYELIKTGRTDFHGYPKQDIWFVNAARSIETQYLSKFNGFSNKILACLVNSFEEFILLDADTVTLKEPDYFFNHKKYRDTGTYFFRDRMFTQYRSSSDTVLLKKLLPSLEDSIFFNIPQTSNLTLGNEFMHGLSHYMESGLVVINRRRHFMQPFMMSIMNFYRPIVGSFYGDKEHFWTSLALVGDENYAFNGNPAAAIGELTPETERHKDVNKVQSFHSKEICSNHPAHISDEDDHLIWFNSGFQFCGELEEMNAEDEFKIGTRYTNLKTLEEFKEFFAAPLKIRHAIIPPTITPFENIKDNVENEPKIPWSSKNYCHNYCWCAYSSLGGYYKEGPLTKSNKREGRVIEFSNEEIDHFEEFSRIWNEPLN